MEKDQNTQVAEYLAPYSPLEFLGILANSAKHSSTHWQEPDIQSRDVKREGFAIWAKQYQACIDLIHKLEQEVKDAKQQSAPAPASTSQV